MVLDITENKNSHDGFLDEPVLPVTVKSRNCYFCRVTPSMSNSEWTDGPDSFAAPLAR